MLDTEHEKESSPSQFQGALTRERQGDAQENFHSRAGIDIALGNADGDGRRVALVGFYCGMRLNDACNLRWHEIDLVSARSGLQFKNFVWLFPF